MNDAAELRRALRGGLWGAAATLIMTLFMATGLGWSRGLGPVSRPFPRLIAEQVLGRPDGAGPILLGMFAHLVYGTLAGVVFAYVARPMTFAKGVGLGLFLWWVMQITFVPWMGMYDFGLLYGFRFAFGALILHLLYGATLGFLGARDEARHHATFDDLGRLQSPA